MLKVLALGSFLTLIQPPGPPAEGVPPGPPPPDGPVIVIETSMGPIEVQLYQTLAPQSTQNFMNYAKSGFFAGTIFHRVIPNFMIQGGGLDAKMVEKPTQAPVRNEAKNGLQNSRGTLAMARTSDPHSATSQFFINVKDNHALDFGIARDGWGYTVFGRVLSGMETVDAIVSVPTTYRGPHQNVPVTPVAITRVRVVSESATAPATPATTRPGAGRRPGVLRPGGGRLKPTPTPAKKP